MSDTDEESSVIFTGLQIINAVAKAMEMYQADEITDEEALELMRQAAPEWQAVLDAPWDAPEE